MKSKFLLFTGTVAIVSSIWLNPVFANEIQQIAQLDEASVILEDQESKTVLILDNIENHNDVIFNPGKRLNSADHEDYSYNVKEYLFEDGDYYWIKRFSFKNEKESSFQTSFKIDGDAITIRYVDPETKEWVNTLNLENVKPTTLYIDTDKASMVISVPAVYKNDFTNNTLEIMGELEKPLKIEKVDDGFMVTASFPHDPDIIGELWAVQSKEPLIVWDVDNFNYLKTHDLALERRWSFDGYYFQSPSNYVPYNENTLYRNSANFTGGSFSKYDTSRFALNMGYVMMDISAKNQNDEGFWPTGSKSLWLESDFEIKENFYDTRFSTDFATSLLYAYKRYNEKEFLNYALEYAEYLCKHAQDNHYEPEGGGWLVEDYAGTVPYKRTHVSLNHQLAELNFLYQLYDITMHEEYKNVADLMLLGIENTRNKWVLPDNNLEYALYYEGTANIMADYPYLTYNDLFLTKEILNKYFNMSSDTISYLMACKKQWMDNNNITGYHTESKL